MKQHKNEMLPILTAPTSIRAKLVFGLMAIMTLVAGLPTGMAQQPDPNSPRIITVEALRTLLKQPNEDFESSAKSVLASDRFEDLKLSTIAARKLVVGRSISEIMLESETEGQFIYEGNGSSVVVDFELSRDAPIRITRISAVEKSEDNQYAKPFSWDSLDRDMKQMEKDGFEGVVLLTRNGEIAFNKAYGFSNREKQIKNKTDTVFAIGSAPIDFTHAGILLLLDEGKLKLEDRITDYFENVPNEKQAITIGHLMQGQSGLRNFHDIPADKNKDHSWIDRDEAVKRILAQELLFQPGEGNEHSHSAWGLLAAIIEITSQQTYQDFTKEHLFQPAGMMDTGFFGEPVPEPRIAVGYGAKSSDPNSPPHWGKTSWLVMGSGGQVSTLGDMHRWQIAMQNGTILSRRSTKKYLGLGDGIHANGDMFGFEFVHSTRPDSMFMVISNSVKSREDRMKFKGLWQSLYRLIQSESKSQKYSLGISMGVTSDEDVVVREVFAGSPADVGGLQAGDRLISANGNPFRDDPMAVLQPLLATGRSIEFSLIRDGKPRTLTVQPVLTKE